MIVFQKYIIYQIGYVCLNVSVNLLIISLFKTRDGVYMPCSGLVCYSKINVIDFQCKHKGEYTLYVNILFSKVWHLYYE